MKKMRIFFVLIFTFYVFFTANLSYAGLEGNIYKVSYVCYDSKGNKRWQATAEIQHKEGDVFIITENMRGIYSGFNDEISWIARTEFKRTKDTVRPLSMEQRVFDRSEKQVALNKQDFNYADMVVTCIQEDLVKNKTIKKKFEFSKDIVNRLLQGVYVQKFIENGKVDKEIQVITPEPALYNVRLKMVGKEDIEINGRKRTAFKICFDPMLGFLNFVKVFLPKAYVWHSSEPIYELLKYEGPESGVNSCNVEIVSQDKNVPKTIPFYQGSAN